MKTLTRNFASSILINGLIWFVAPCYSHLSSQEVPIIDVEKALNSPKELKLSQIVSHTEMVELESKPEYRLKNCNWVDIGKQYIMAGETGPMAKLLIFDRKGKYIRQIGAAGQRQGEYMALTAAAMSPDEKLIVLGDVILRKVMIFTIEGKLIRETNLPDININGGPEAIHFINDTVYAVQLRRYNGSPQMFDVVIFNERNEVLKSYFPVTDPQKQKLVALRQVLGISDSGMYFWENFENNLFYFTPFSEAVAAGHFETGPNGIKPELLNSFEDFDWTQEQRNKKLYLIKIENTPKYLLAGGLNQGSMFIIGYDKLTGESFSINRTDTCSITSKNWPSLENDIFGIEPVFLNHYQPDLNCMVLPISLQALKSGKDFNCLRKRTVSEPEILNQIISRAEASAESDNQVLVLLHLKR